MCLLIKGATQSLGFRPFELEEQLVAALINHALLEDALVFPATLISTLDLCSQPQVAMNE